MKVIVYPSDNGGCGHYRMRWPAEALANQGYDVEVATRMPRVVKQGEKVIDVLPIYADAIVLQRPCLQQIIEAIQLIQKQGVKVIIDMDDDLGNIHPKNKAYAPYNTPHMHHTFANQACELADIVTVSTPALAERYAPHGRFAVLPNCVPESFLKININRDPGFVTVGWAGQTMTHPEDLQITHGAINEALANQRARFFAMGDQKTLDNLGIRYKYPHNWMGPVPLQQYPWAVAQFDIGIVPLEKSLFNQTKSWLKALEYSALNIAPVVSPTPDNMRMVDAGAALVAHNPREWSTIVRDLIVDEVTRKDLAARARAFAAGWTIEARAEQWATAWSRLKV